MFCNVCFSIVDFSSAGIKSLLISVLTWHPHEENKKQLSAL